jgi:hypothetical protein
LRLRVKFDVSTCTVTYAVPASRPFGISHLRRT